MRKHKIILKEKKSKFLSKADIINIIKLKKSQKVKLSRKHKNREIITFISSDSNFIGKESKILKDEVEHDFGTLEEFLVDTE